ncbi:MAG: ABC transporter permease [Pseudomonadales bacterium]
MAAFAVMFDHRRLISSLASREIQTAYKGSFFGFMWLIIQPVMLLSIYGFVFGFVLQARFGGDENSEVSYALSLYLGLIVFFVFSESLTRAPSLVTGNVNFVKKVVFPVEILPIVVLVGSVFRATVSFCVWLLCFLAVYGLPPITIFLVPLLFIPLCAFSLSIAWFFSALGVYFRDLAQTVGILSTATLFLSGIFYPLSLIPEEYRGLLYLSPVTSLVEQMRLVAIYGESIPVETYLLVTGISLVCFFFSHRWFQLLRRGFSDVL